ncbi:LysR family transcriptional regulator substrate-binding protein [Streptosporangium subroseum]|uniref:LysR family transcriptional regulator substrate-binding protein n=1 Tax=Streptosporangium subroseum TaxID=106412 RepID=UPI003B83A1C1
MAAAYRRRHPGVEVRIRETDLTDPNCGLRTGLVDVALTHGPFDETSLTVHEPRADPVGAVLRTDDPPARRPGAEPRGCGVERGRREPADPVVRPDRNGRLPRLSTSWPAQDYGTGGRRMGTRREASASARSRRLTDLPVEDIQAAGGYRVEDRRQRPRSSFRSMRLAVLSQTRHRGLWLSRVTTLPAGNLDHGQSNWGDSRSRRRVRRPWETTPSSSCAESTTWRWCART